MLVNVLSLDDTQDIHLKKTMSKLHSINLSCYRTMTKSKKETVTYECAHTQWQYVTNQNGEQFIFCVCVSWVWFDWISLRLLIAFNGNGIDYAKLENSLTLKELVMLFLSEFPAFLTNTPNCLNSCFFAHCFVSSLDV